MLNPTKKVEIRKNARASFCYTWGIIKHHIANVSRHLFGQAKFSTWEENVRCLAAKHRLVGASMIF